MSYEGPGVYEHYKGGRYRVLGVAKHESDHRELVIYQELEPEDWLEGAEFVARPLRDRDGPDSFVSSARIHGKPVPRFRRVE